MKPTAEQTYQAVRNHQCPTRTVGARIWEVLVSDKANPRGRGGQQVTLDRVGNSGGHCHAKE